MTSIGNTIAILNTVDSSNNYAMEQVHAGLAMHGQVWLAMQQTEGKGQRGKEWKTKPGENITMSVVLDTSSFPITWQFRLSVAVSLAVKTFFSAYVIKENIMLKWPNDLYWNDKKAGGILIENVVGRAPGIDKGADISPFSILLAQPPPAVVWKWAIVGIGININQIDFPSDIPNPVSLQQITGKTYDITILARQLCNCLEDYWQQLCQGAWPALFHQYNQSLYKKGKMVRLRKNNVVMPCTIRGVNETGKLLIAEDHTVSFDFGEIKWEL